MNRSQSLDQSLERVYQAACVVHANGLRPDVLAIQLNNIVREANAAFGMMDVQPNACTPSTVHCLHKEALGALCEARRQGGGRPEMVAYHLSRVYFGANNRLVQLGQAI